MTWFASVSELAGFCGDFAGAIQEKLMVSDAQAAATVSEHIRPGTCPDICRQFIPGFRGELFDVTSLNRPDTNWRHVDARGHVHQWYVGDKPAEAYSPLRTYTLPTLINIVDDPGDDEHPSVSHYECRQCRELA